MTGRARVFGLVEIENVRRVGSAAMALSPGLTLFCGPNGAGKTSVLEAIHLVSTGRSFRTARVAEVISRGANRLMVRASLARGTDVAATLGLEKDDGGSVTRFRYKGQDLRTAAEAARLVPLSVITPDSHRLLTDGGDLRRRLIDWTLFHVEPPYHESLQAYRRTLRQRNALLKSGSASSLSTWDGELARAGETLGTLREHHLARILPVVGKMVRELTGMKVTVGYRRGWKEGESLGEVIERSRENDRIRGFTGSGPHRADLDLRVEDRPAQQVVSRGEGKLLTIGLLLAQARHLAEVEGQCPVVLIDDLASELDEINREKVFVTLAGLGLQTIVTAVSESLIPWAAWSGAARFHVEQGKVREVV